LAENDISQAAFYGVYRFANGAYVSGLVGAGASNASTERRFIAGALDYALSGEIEGEILLATVEGGVNIDLASLTLTPNISLRQTVLRTGAFTEEGGEAALQFGEQRYQRSEARLGARLAGEVSLS